MRWITQLRLRLRTLFSRHTVEQELDEELQYHLQRQIEEDIARGVQPAEAMLAARRSAMGIESRKEECRDARGLEFFENLWRDLRIAVRQLRRSPGFTTAAILTLAIGVCASTAIFALVDVALLQPLPYSEPGSLVAVTESAPLFPKANLSYLDYLDWKRQNVVFNAFDVFQGSGFLLSTPAGTEPVPAARVSDGFFRTLGVRPLLGRDFYPGEDLPGAPHNVVLTHAAWQKRFGGSADVTGRTLMLSGVPYTIIGVLPQEFQFAPMGATEFWVALNTAGSCEKRRSCHNLYGVARLKDGISVTAALSNMTAIAKQLEQQYPKSNREQGASVVPLAEIITGDIRSVLLALLCGAGLLLFIAYVNVASLLLVRAENRRREIAVRGALGASRGRLLSQFVTEGFLLVSAGCLIGLTGAGWGIRLLLKLVPDDMLSAMPFLSAAGVTPRVLICTIAVSLLAAVLLALTPAAYGGFGRIEAGLAEGSRGSAGLAWRRLGSKLVIAEFATAMVLLSAVGVLSRGLYRLLHVDLGFQPQNLATLRVAAPEDIYANAQRSALLGNEIISKLRTLPGVESAAIAGLLPVSYNGNTGWIRFADRPWNGEHNEVNARAVSSDYFRTVRANLLKGRSFTDADDLSNPRVAIVNQALVKQYFQGKNPVGTQIGNLELSPESMTQIVGVVEDIREGSLDSTIMPALYRPFSQDSDNYFSVVVRTKRQPEMLLPAMKAAVRQLHPEVGTTDEITMESRIYRSQSASLHRSAVWLAGAFASLALLLSVVGLYGVIAYSVSQRTREIGVRMALGAEPPSVRRMILREAVRLVAAATVIGIIASVAVASTLQTLFFGVSSVDLPALAAVTALLCLAAMVAACVPAQRAASVNPVEALRAE